MWRALLRKARADLLSRPLQSTLLLAVVAAGVASLTLAILVQQSTSHSFEQFVEDANGGHAWFFGSEERLSEIARRPEVVEAGQPMAALDGGRLISTTTPYTLSFFAIDRSVPSVAPGVVTSGRWLRAGADDEAVLDRGVAADAGIEVGDFIEVAARGGTSELTIVGLVIPTSRAPYPLWKHARVFVTEDRLIELGGGSPAYHAAGYILEARTAAPDFVASVFNTYPAGDIGGRAWQTIRDSIVEENDATFILLGVFATFALGASLFIIANAITGQVQSQLRDVGLLKAIGFTPSQVTRLLVGETLLLGMLATALGVLVGWVSAPLFLDRVQQWLGSTEPASPGWRQIALTLFGVTALVIVATALPAWQAGRTSTIRAIRSAQPGAGRRTGLAARLASRLRLPRFIAIAMKDLFARSTRAWLTIAAVGVASAAIVATLTIEGTLDKVANDPTAVGGEPFELQLEPVVAPGPAGGEEIPRITHEEIVSLIDNNPDVETYLTRLWIPIQISGQRFAAYAVGGRYVEFDYPILDGRIMSPGDSSEFEAMMALGLASRLGIEVGDTAEFRAQGRTGTHTAEVVGIYLDNDNDGLTMSLDATDVRRVAPELEEGAYGLKIANHANADRVASALIRAADGRVIVDTTNDDVEEDIAEIQDVVRPVMIALSGFLLALVSLNLLSTLQLSVRERIREIGLLKAIGFTPAQVIASIISGAVVLAALGAVIGVPVGWLFVRFVFEQSASDGSFDAGALVQRPEWFWFPLLAVMALVVAALGSGIPARGAARTSVSAALRYE